MDPVLVRHLQKLSDLTHCKPSQLFECTPWKYIWENPFGGWIYAGRTRLECVSNARRSDPEWKPADELTIEVVVNYPRSLTKRKKAVGKAAASRIYSGHLFKLQFSGGEDEEPPGDVSVHIARCIDALRLNSTPSRGEEVISSPGLHRIGDSFSSDGYIRTVLNDGKSSPPGDILSALLLLISPPPSISLKSAARVPLLGSSGEFIGTFSTNSGNAFVRIMHGGRDLGKLGSLETNTMAVLLGLRLIRVAATLTESPPNVIELGTSIPFQLDVWFSPLLFSVGKIREILIAEAQAVLRNATVALFTRLLGLKPVKESILWRLAEEHSKNGDGRPGGSAGLGASGSMEGGSEGVSTSGETTDEEEEVEEDEDEMRMRNDLYLGESFGESSGCSLNLNPDPTIFKSKLRKYQLVAFNWMVSRELGSKARLLQVADPKASSSGELTSGSMSDRPGLGGEVRPGTAKAAEKAANPLWDMFRLREEIWLNHVNGEVCRGSPENDHECLGGILADEMGLGKTVEILALLSTDYVKEPIQKPTGPTLLILPLSLMNQWVNEIRRHLTEILPNQRRLTVLQFHGPDRPKQLTLIQAADIVITTYGTVVADAAADGLLGCVMFHRIILDEAHFIKSRNTRTARSVFGLNGKFRWCLTGTPIQNTLNDLYSLFHFLRVEPWGHWYWWQKLLSQEEDAVSRLRLISSNLLLRRTLHTIDPHTNLPIVSLPSKTIVSVWLEFTKDEKVVYDQLYTNAIKDFNSLLQKGPPTYISVLQLLLRLRQSCCHPLLLQSSLAHRQGFQITPDTDLDSLAKSMAASAHISVHTGTDTKPIDHNPSGFIKAQLLKALPKASNALSVNYPQSSDSSSGTSKGDNAGVPTEAQCPICMDIPDEPCILHCGHILCRECAHQALAHSQQTAYVSTGAGESNRVKQKIAQCPVCRAQFSLLNVHALSGAKNQGSSSWEVMISKLAYDSDGRFIHSTKFKALRRIVKVVVQSGYRLVIFSQWVTQLDLIQRFLQDEKVQLSRLDGSQSAKKRREQVELFTMQSADPPKHPPPTLKDFFPLHTVHEPGNDGSSKAPKVEPDRPAEGEGPSADGEEPTEEGLRAKRRKIDRKDEMKEGMKVSVESSGDGKPRDEKRRNDVSIFVDVTGMENEPLIEATSNGCEVGRVLLVSLKAGGVGLNLTCGNFLVLMDSWWNPAVEDQAIQRIHRLGQTLPVLIFRLYMLDSIEQKVLNLQRSKGLVFKSLLEDKHKLQQVSQLLTADL